MFLAIMIWAVVSVIWWFATEDAPVAFKAFGTVVIAFWVTVGYVAVHFIGKFW